MLGVTGAKGFNLWTGEWLLFSHLTLSTLQPFFPCLLIAYSIAAMNDYSKPIRQALMSSFPSSRMVWPRQGLTPLETHACHQTVPREARGLVSVHHLTEPVGIKYQHCPMVHVCLLVPKWWHRHGPHSAFPLWNWHCASHLVTWPCANHFPLSVRVQRPHTVKLSAWDVVGILQGFPLIFTLSPKRVRK